MKGRWLVLLLTCSIGAMLTTGCGRSKAAPTQPKRDDAIPVTVARVETIAWDRAITVVGTLFAKDEAAVSAEVEGTVEGTLVDFGDRVRDGQELALIDTASYDALAQQAAGNLAKAEANAANAEQNLKRVKELNGKGVSSPSDLDLATAQSEQWRAEVKAARGAEAIARLNLARSKVRAPFDGAIAQRIANKGDYFKIGSPLFQVVNDSVLKFIFQVPEKYASFVKKELPVTFQVDNYPTETFEGTVYLISPSVNLASRAFNVGALVPNSDYKLKANTFGRGQLVLERNVQTLVVPLEAVVSFAGVTKVFVVEGSVAKSRTVQVGRAREGRQEILNGLKGGESVVVSGHSKLHDGVKVSIKSASGLTAAAFETSDALDLGALSFPSPCPSPRGEGTAFAVVDQSAALSLSMPPRIVLPLPTGEGWGEGKGDAWLTAAREINGSVPAPVLEPEKAA